MTVLKDFLLRVPKSINNDTVFVVGNESADCDSVVSAIAYAFLCKRPNHVPLVNNRKAVLSLRAEVALALSSAGLSVDDLLYVEDVQHKFDSFRFFLVDHNEPSAKWSRLGLKYEVVGILDHHVDGGLFKHVTPRTIKTCASTTSLIIESFDGIEEPVKEMLMTALTFDTTNWTWRVTDFDVEMAKRLLGLQSNCTKDDLHELCKPIITNIERAWINEDAVDPLALMQKDYKMYQKGDDLFYGISVIHVDLTTIKDLERVMRETMRSDGLKAHIILSAVRLPGQYSFYQQFALCCDDEATFKTLTGFLISDIKLVAINDIPPSSTFTAYNQLDLETSRKRLQPLVHSLL